MFFDIHNSLNLPVEVKVKGMTSFRERTSGITNGFVTAAGSYLIVLFGGVLLYRVVTL